MPLKPLSYREVRRKLEKAGFARISQKGSHAKFVRYGDHGVRTVTVPHHREITVGTLRSILSQAGLTPNELDRL